MELGKAAYAANVAHLVQVCAMPDGVSTFVHKQWADLLPEHRVYWNAIGDAVAEELARREAFGRSGG